MDDNAGALVLTDLFSSEGSDSQFDRYDWQPFRPGVEICPLYGDDATGPSAALLRYAPGARIPSHRHGGYENILILSGSQCDEHTEYGAGTLVVSAPQSSHAITSRNGCVVLAIWHSPVEFVG
jgi:anti-sigma factor ChrR (cupin superfamily)